MGYLLTEQQEELRSMIDEFYTKELDPLIPEYEEKGETPMQFVKQGIQMGLHAMDIPEEYGGMGLDDRTTTILVEEMARHDAGVSSAFTITAMAMKCVLEMGSEEQKKRTGALITAGKIGAFCLTEPQAGSNAAALKTSAVREGDHYVINGTKTFITNGGIADFFIVMAMTDKSKGVKGISAFIVERGPGVTSGKHENKMGMRLSNTTEVVFEDAVVPAENLLGKEGLGYITAMKALDGGRASVAASAIGIAQRALEEAVKYSKLRIAFDQPIGNFQAVQFMIADMEVGIEASRGLVEKFLEKKDRGLPYAKEGAMCKLFATDTVMKVTTDAVQIFGGYGYSKDYPVEKLMRDAKVYQIFEGTNQIQRMVIAKFAGSEY